MARIRRASQLRHSGVRFVDQFMSQIAMQTIIMIEVVLNDRLGKKVRVKCNEDDTIGDLKKLAAAQLGTRPEKLKIQKWYTVYKGRSKL